MSYNVLTKESGGSADDRRSEADRILKIIRGYEHSLTQDERNFVARKSGNTTVSTKEIFWLRDIKDRVTGG